MDLWAKLPTVVAVEQRRRHGLPPIPPDPSLSFAENFFHMCSGTVPDEDVVRCFEISLILYAEHGFNASTFTARVITSTLSDLYSAITGAIGALKGPLHGGANEAVMGLFTEVKAPAEVDEWLSNTLGFGAKGHGLRAPRLQARRQPGANNASCAGAFGRPDR